MSHELFQVSAKAILFNEDKSKIVLLHYDDKWSKYSIPGGHTEAGEAIEETIRRELQEELGIKYTGELKLASISKYRSISLNTDKIDLNYVGELPESTPVSIENNGDGIVNYEWASVEAILRGDYEDWLVGVLKGVVEK